MGETALDRPGKPLEAEHMVPERVAAGRVDRALAVDRAHTARP